MERVTAMFLTAALFNQMVRDVPAAFQPLRHLLVGGAALDPAAYRGRWRRGAAPAAQRLWADREHDLRGVVRGAGGGAGSALGADRRPLANTTRM